jgi:hypothetical protein
MISGPTLSGQPGKAVGHAVGKLTLRHDLARVPRRLESAAVVLGFALDVKSGRRAAEVQQLTRGLRQTSQKIAKGAS